MDQQLVNSVGEKLQRLKTNDSTNESIFSRNASSSSVTTIYTPIPKSLSFTKINNNPVSFNFGDALESALNNISYDQPKSLNKLTTTPTNEPTINSKWCIILVGLPAAGKSSICKNLIKQATDHLNIDGNFKIDSFNAGNFRRKLSDFETQSSNFFDFNNQEAKTQRDNFAHIALDHLLNSLINSQIDVGVFDATNSTIERRENIISSIKEKEMKTGVIINTVILHVKCTDQSFWKFNIEGKTNGPDYINKNHDDAISDFVRRADLYQKAFQDISESELKKNEGLVYLEIDNCGKNFKINDNNFNFKNDTIFKELSNFIQNYYTNFGMDYEKKVEKFYSGRLK